MQKEERRVNESEALEQLKGQMSTVSPEKIEELSNKGDEVDKKTKSLALKKFRDQILLMFQLIDYYVKGKYNRIAWRSIAAVAGTLLYVLLPVDLIPDMIPVAGFLDDAGVVAAALKLIGIDLKGFSDWKNKEDHEEKGGN